MPQITISSRNPADIRIEEVQSLAQKIRASIPDCEIQATGKEQLESRKGVTWFQILDVHILVAAATGAAVVAGNELIQEITKIVIEWARARFKANPESKRPIYIPIYGPDGKIVKSVVVKNATDEPEDRTQEDRKLFNR